MKIVKLAFRGNTDSPEFYGIFDSKGHLLSMHLSKNDALSWRKTPAEPVARDEREMTRAQKVALAKQIRDYTLDELNVDFQKLQKIGRNAGQLSPRTKVGNKIVDAFTFVERLNTVSGAKGRNMNFFHFWQNRAKYESRENIRNFMEYQKKDRDPTKIQAMWYNLFRLYYGSINIFKPLFAMEHYSRYTARTAVLDFTMGWGGRMVGACALDIPKYIGVDANRKLRPLLQSMASFLRERSNTEIELYFQDARTLNYQQLEYDMVFTSPPYYNLEKYTGVRTWNSKKQWDEEFYWPIFWLAFNYMQKGGHFCVNVSTEIYNRACVPLLGHAHDKYEFYRESRGVAREPEYVYIWNKD